MKITKICLITLQVVIAVGNVFSQNIYVGIRTGASYFKIHNEEFGEDGKYTLGTDIAIAMESAFSPVFSIQTELHFTQKGVQFEDDVEIKGHILAVKTNYLELPVMLKAQVGSEKFKCYAFVAPSPAFATNRFTIEKSDVEERVKEDVEFIDTDEAKSQRWEFNAIGGLGASMKAGVGSLVMDIRYSLGLSDNTKFKIDKPDDWTKSTNRGCTISLGYMIPLGRK